MKTNLSLAWKLGLIISLVSLSSVPAQDASKDVTPPAPAASDKTPKLSAWTKEIVKLADARIDEEVMLSFVDNSGTFNLGADQIIHLNSVGVPPAVVNAMLRHDQEIIAGLRMLTISSDPGYAGNEPLLQLKLITTNVAPAKPAPQPAAVTAPSMPPLLPKTELAVAPEIPAAETSVVGAQPPAAPLTSNFANVRKPTVPPVANKVTPIVPVAKKPNYPVRGTQAEELLPPILIVKAVTRTPNVFIIEGFPPE